ncbi:diguanylate cyclase [Halothiobacillus sp. DCM-1]|uniref:sensor domain-containing diguanylate cyclase n=1 Tax=Halothiobacillus sp. DCM-1 TaxID=3112558 RepID=UPI0032432559
MAFAWPPAQWFWLAVIAVALFWFWLPSARRPSSVVMPTEADSGLPWWAESPVVLYRIDLAPTPGEPRRDQLSENLKTVFGHDPAQIDEPMAWWQAHLHPEDLSAVLQASDYLHWPDEGRLRRYRFLNGRGQYVWVGDSARVIRDDAGRPRWLVGSMLNIESQMQLRQQLEREEQRYRLITQNLQEIISLHSADGRLLWLTPSTRALLGYKPEQLLSGSLAEFIHPDAWQAWLGLREQGAESWLDRALIYQLRLPTGEWRWMESRFTRFVGEPFVAGASLQAVTRDVHERVLIEQRLRESEQLYRSIFDHADALIFVVGVEPDGDFMFLAHNRRHQEITGLVPGQFARRRPHEMLPMDLADWITANYRECVRRAAPLHYVQYGDWRGVTRYLDMVLTPIFDEEGAVTMLIGLATDITAQRQQFLALQRTTHRLEQVLGVARLADFTADLAEGQLNGSERLRHWFALEQPPEPGLVLPPVLQPFAGLMAAVAVPDRPRLIGLLSDLAQGVLSDIRRDVLMRLRDGQERWMAWSVRRLSASPEVLRIEGSLQDVTERVAAERAVARASRRDAAILRTVAEGIIGVDAEGLLSFANPAARQLLGLSGQSVTGRSATLVYDNQLPQEHFLLALTDGRSRGGVQSAFYRQGEGFFPVRWSVAVLPDEFDVEKNGLVVVFSDISEIKRHEAMLAQLATTDELTGLPNRRAFIDRLDEEFSRAGRYHLPASVMMLDLDHFKRVNDTHGHAAGDAVLRAFAQLLRQMLRKPDVCGRLGGEEFAVLLPNTPCRGAFEIADRLRLAVEGLRVPIDTSDGTVEIGCTVSIGVCDLLQGAQNASEALNLADRALYRAKTGGRNQVCGCEALSEACTPSSDGVLMVNPRD